MKYLWFCICCCSLTFRFYGMFPEHFTLHTAQTHSAAPHWWIIWSWSHASFCRLCDGLVFVCYYGLVQSRGGHLFSLKGAPPLSGQTQMLRSVESWLKSLWELVIMNHGSYATTVVLSQLFFRASWLVGWWLICDAATCGQERWRTIEREKEAVLIWIDELSVQVPADKHGGSELHFGLNFRFLSLLSPCWFAL